MGSKGKNLRLRWHLRLISFSITNPNKVTFSCKHFFVICDIIYDFCAGLFDSRNADRRKEKDM